MRTRHSSRYVAFVALVALVVWLSGCSGLAELLGLTGATVKGSVLELPSREGVSGIHVTVGGESATTGADGKYTIEDVDEGNRAFSVAVGDAWEVVASPPAAVVVPGSDETLDLDAVHGPTYLIDADYGSGSLPEPPNL